MVTDDHPLGRRICVLPTGRRASSGCEAEGDELRAGGYDGGAAGSGKAVGVLGVHKGRDPVFDGADGLRESFAAGGLSDGACLLLRSPDGQGAFTLRGGPHVAQALAELRAGCGGAPERVRSLAERLGYSPRPGPRSLHDGGAVEGHGGG